MFQGIYQGIKNTCSSPVLDENMKDLANNELQVDAKHATNANEKQALTVIGSITVQTLDENDLADDTKDLYSCSLWEGAIMGWRNVASFSNC